MEHLPECLQDLGHGFVLLRGGLKQKIDAHGYGLSSVST